jgi:hypothetical protein
MDVSQGELKLKTVMKAHLSQRERKGQANLSPTRQITAINGVAGGNTLIGLQLRVKKNLFSMVLGDIVQT